jgi:hypothetical protein
METFWRWYNGIERHSFCTRQPLAQVIYSETFDKDTLSLCFFKSKIALVIPTLYMRIKWDKICKASGKKADTSRYSTNVLPLHFFRETVMD